MATAHPYLERSNGISAEDARTGAVKYTSKWWLNIGITKKMQTVQHTTNVLKFYSGRKQPASCPIVGAIIW